MCNPRLRTLHGSNPRLRAASCRCCCSLLTPTARVRRHELTAGGRDKTSVESRRDETSDETRRHETRRHERRCERQRGRGKSGDGRGDETRVETGEETRREWRRERTKRRICDFAHTLLPTATHAAARPTHATPLHTLTSTSDEVPAIYEVRASHWQAEASYRSLTDEPLSHGLHTRADGLAPRLHSGSRAEATRPTRAATHAAPLATRTRCRRRLRGCTRRVALRGSPGGRTRPPPRRARACPPEASTPPP